MTVGKNLRQSQCMSFGTSLRQFQSMTIVTRFGKLNVWPSLYDVKTNGSWYKFY